MTVDIQDKRSKERERRKKKIKDAESAEEQSSVKDDLVIKRMGIVKYYLMPWRRKHERIMIAKIAAVDAQLEAEQKAAEKQV